MPKLIVCAGKQRRKGWKTLDANPAVKPDYLCEVPPLPDKVRETEWEAIELIHGIEHFYKWDAIFLLREFHSILVEGGKLILEQPNIEYAAKVLLGQKTAPKGAKGQFDMWPLYGDPSHKSELFCHRWGYTPRTLREALVKAGFKNENIEWLPAKSHFPVRDFRMEATK